MGLSWRFRVIDEKCLSDKFRGRRRTGGRAPLAVASRRIDRSSPCDIFLCSRESFVVLLLHKWPHKIVTKIVTTNALFTLSTGKRAQHGPVI